MCESCESTQIYKTFIKKEGEVSVKQLDFTKTFRIINDNNYVNQLGLTKIFGIKMSLFFSLKSRFFNSFLLFFLLFS